MLAGGNRGNRNIRQGCAVEKSPQMFRLRHFKDDPSNIYMFPTAYDEAIDNDPKNYELAKERPDQLKKIIDYLYTRLRKETRGVRPAGRKIPSARFLHPTEPILRLLLTSTERRGLPRRTRAPLPSLSLQFAVRPRVALRV
jgi:hypothetical protein